MNIMLNYLIGSAILLGSYQANGQNNYLEFSKKDKTTVIIEAGKKISFVLLNEETWSKGELVTIGSDSLFIQQKKSSSLYQKGDSNYEVNAYSMKDFDMLAYTNTGSVVKGSAKTLLIIASVVMLVPLTNEVEPTPGKKFFQKNIVFDEGWEAKIVRATN